MYPYIVYEQLDVNILSMYSTKNWSLCCMNVVDALSITRCCISPSYIVLKLPSITLPRTNITFAGIFLCGHLSLNELQFLLLSIK